MKLFAVRTALFLVLWIFHSAVQAELVDKIIAKVGSEVITQSDVQESLQAQKSVLTQQFGHSKGLKEYQQYKKNALNEMILERLLSQHVRQLGLSASKTEIDQEFKARLARAQITSAQLESQLKRRGSSIDAFKKQVKAELEKQKLMQKKIVPQMAISDLDLKAEYEKNIKDFQRFTEMKFIEVLLPVNRFESQEQAQSIAQQIHTQLKRGGRATSLIQKYSEGAFSSTGGASGWVETKNLRQEIQGLLSQLKPGQTSDVLPAGGAILIFKLLDRRNPQPLPFNTVMPQVRARYSERVMGEELRRYLEGLKTQIYVEIYK